MACYLQQNSGGEPPATNFCYERKTVLIFEVNPKPRDLLRWAIALSFPGETVRATPTHTQERRRVLGRAGPRRSRGRGPSFSSPPAVSDRSGGGAGPSQAVRTKPAGARRADPDPSPGGRRAGRSRWGTYPAAAHSSPRGVWSESGWRPH